jgi:zinc transporter ZupT
VATRSARNDDDDDAPGRVFWAIVFLGLPLLGFGVALLTFAVLRPVVAFWLTGVAVGVLAVAVLPALPRLRRRPTRARASWALLGGLVAGIATILWLGAVLFVALLAECLPNGCP